MSESNSGVTEKVDEDGLKVKFTEKINNLNKDKCSFHIKNKQMYEQIICEVESAKVDKKKTSLQYRRLKRYDVVCFGDEKKLIKPLSGTKNIQYYVTNDELFDVIERAHLESGHGGRDLTMKALNKKYANVTKECVNYYLDLCQTCHKKKSHPKKGLVVKPLLFKEIHARGQVDLIDMQRCPDRDYKYILNYQDHLSKFLILRPLRTKTAQEVAHVLLDIFCILGAPSVLQSNNGREFANHVVEELKGMWPELSIVHGKSHHSQSQGSSERANQHVQQTLFAWMDDNKTNRWSEGLRFYQLQKNCAYHHGIQQSPFEVMFGRKAHVGIDTLPDSIKKILQTEEELENAIKSTGQKQIDTDDTPQRDEMEISGLSSSKVSSDMISILGPSSSKVTSDVISIPGPTSSKITSDVVCCICLQESSGVHTCTICNQVVHVACADSTLGADYEGLGSKVMCMRCAQTENRKINKGKAVKVLEAHANAMKQLSEQKFPPIAIGKTVTIPIPSFDSAKGDARIVLGIILDKTGDGLYRVGTKHGTINTLFSRNQIKESKDNFLNFKDVPNVKLSLREISAKDSKFGGQGFIKCHCNKKCSSKLCKCKRSDVLCNSKCHNASPCLNKE